jgi:predicted membrane GTPase involved in stress response
LPNPKRDPNEDWGEFIRALEVRREEDSGRLVVNGRINRPAVGQAARGFVHTSAGTSIAIGIVEIFAHYGMEARPGLAAAVSGLIVAIGNVITRLGDGRIGQAIEDRVVFWLEPNNRKRE